MFRLNRLLLFLAATGALTVVSCGSATSTPAPTQASQAITVIVTATLPPPTATSEAPSITPLPTVGATNTLQPTTPTKAASAKVTPKPAATKKPAAPAASATPSPLPMKFGAPSLNKPVWTDNTRDEVQFPGGAIVLDWQSVGGLNGDECYLVQVSTEPVNPAPGIGTKSDYWVTNCGDQTGQNSSVKFTLESPNRPGSLPSYASILLDTGQMWAHWSITVVKNLGQCDPSYKYHCKTAPISGAGTAYFLFKGS